VKPGVSHVLNPPRTFCPPRNLGKERKKQKKKNKKQKPHHKPTPGEKTKTQSFPLWLLPGFFRVGVPVFSLRAVFFFLPLCCVWFLGGGGCGKAHSFLYSPPWCVGGRVPTFNLFGFLVVFFLFFFLLWCALGCFCFYSHPGGREKPSPQGAQSFVSWFLVWGWPPPGRPGFCYRLFLGVLNPPPRECLTTSAKIPLVLLGFFWLTSKKKNVLFPCLNCSGGLNFSPGTL